MNGSRESYQVERLRAELRRSEATHDKVLVLFVSTARVYLLGLVLVYPQSFCNVLGYLVCLSLESSTRLCVHPSAVTALAFLSHLPTLLHTHVQCCHCATTQ